LAIKPKIDIKAEIENKKIRKEEKL